MSGSLSLSIVLSICLTICRGQDDKHKMTAEIDGNIQIGALFPIHRKGTTGQDSCGSVWEQYGIQRTEIALKTVDEINADEHLLGKIVLGIQIRDSCWTERYAMQQTIEFIRVILSQEQAVKALAADSSAEREKKLQCAGEEVSRTNLAAVIGPGSSSTTIATHNLLQVFKVPQIGYSATTKDLSDKNDYKYFMRLVPSDAWQARVMVEMVKRIGWSYVAVVYSDGNYGEKGYEQLVNEFAKKDDVMDTCIAMSEKISSQAPTQDFVDLLDKLESHQPRPNVVICFCEGDTNKKIFETIRDEQNATKWRFQWVGSESWSDRQDVVENSEQEAAGSLILRLYSPKVPSFDQYYWALTPHTNTRNPWFGEFWMQKFQCRLPLTSKSSSSFVAVRNMYSQDCDVSRQNLTQDYEPDPKLNQVVNAIYTVAMGLQSMQEDSCQGYSGKVLCPEMSKLINGSALFEYMKMSSFDDQTNKVGGDKIYFDKNGDPPPRYDILNYQGGLSGYQVVGTYRDIAGGKSTQLNLDMDKILWYNGNKGDRQKPLSICSSPCRSGHIRLYTGSNQCCWNCVQCAPNETVISQSECQQCAYKYWPNHNKTKCVSMNEEYLRWSDLSAMFAMCLSCIGIVATLFTVAVFIRYNHTPLVKATTRELSYMILAAIVVCYCQTFLIIAKPSTFTCYAVRILPGTTFAAIYGALLIKTNRIARILAQDKKKIMTKRPRFLTTRAQVIMTLVLVAVELCIVIALSIVDRPRAYYPPELLHTGHLVLTCDISQRAFLVPYGWDLFLVTLCTVYAVKTRNVPSNFNEAKFIGFTMYTTCIIWIAFIMIYFGSPATSKLTMCVSFSLSATVALLLLFGPRVYIMLRHPEKNVRQSTDPNLRVHMPQSTSTATAHDKADRLSSRTKRLISHPQPQPSTRCNRRQAGNHEFCSFDDKTRKQSHNPTSSTQVKAENRDVWETGVTLHHRKNATGNNRQACSVPGSIEKKLHFTKSVQTDLSCTFDDVASPMEELFPGADMLTKYFESKSSKQAHELEKLLYGDDDEDTKQPSARMSALNEIVGQSVDAMLPTASFGITDQKPNDTPRTHCLADNQSSISRFSVKLKKTVNKITSSASNSPKTTPPNNSVAEETCAELNQPLLLRKPDRVDPQSTVPARLKRQRSDGQDSGILLQQSTNRDRSLTKNVSLSFDRESGVVMDSSKHSSLSSKHSSGKSAQAKHLPKKLSSPPTEQFESLLSEQGLQAQQMSPSTLV